MLSVLVLAHLTAVVAPPLAFQSRGPRGLSPSVSMLLSPLAAYGQFLYLDRGYAFFAPDPGPSHLMRVELAPGGEAPPEEVTPETVARDRQVRLYPSLEDQWPRLLYHRHFMLAEFLNDAYQPALPAETARLVGEELPIEELQAWRTGRERYERIANSMRDHLRHQYGKTEIRIDRLEHMIPDFVPYAENPTPLNDPPTYVLLEDIPITLETLLGVMPQDLPQPEPSESVPAPSGEPIPSGQPQAGPFEKDHTNDSGSPAGSINTNEEPVGVSEGVRPR